MILVQTVCGVYQFDFCQLAPIRALPLKIDVTPIRHPSGFRSLRPRLEDFRSVVRTIIYRIYTDRLIVTNANSVICRFTLYRIIAA